MPIPLICANVACRHFLRMSDIPLHLVASFRLSEKKLQPPRVADLPGTRCRHCGRIHIFVPLTEPMMAHIV